MIPGRAAGRVALITGAARGQGRSHAVRLASEGADVVLVDLCDDVPTAAAPGARRADLDETVRMVHAHGGRAHAVVADVRDPDAMVSAVAAGVDRFGHLDTVVANAGISGFKAFDRIGPAEWQDMIDVNLSGVWFTCQAALPHLVAAGRRGSAVLISSTTAMKGTRNAIHYSAAKLGVVGLARALARELAPHWVRVNAVLPTQVPTPMLLQDSLYGLFRPDLDGPGLEDVLPVFRTLHLLDTPWVEIEDISSAVAFLVSDDARAITGVSLPVDAGKSQR